MYDVYIIVYLKLEGDKVSDTETEYEYVGATAADPGEIVAACQVLFPNMKGILIEPMKP